MQAITCALVMLSLMAGVFGIAERPPMGWNSWDSFQGSPTEAVFYEVSESFLKILAPHGYEYLVIDAGWYDINSTTVENDGFSRLVPSTTLWPSSANGAGFKPIIDYVHSLGLKFGFHVMRGIHKSVVELNQPIYGTDYHAQDIAVESDACPWWEDWYGVNMSHPAAGSYYKSIIELYSSWGADFIKVDCIFAVDFHEQDIITISEAITQSGADILFSLSPGGDADVAEVQQIGKYVNMYRITQDFWDCWDKGTGVCGWCSTVVTHVQIFPEFNSMIGGPGLNGSSWPDGDMLPFGYIMEPGTTVQVPTRLTPDEQTFVMTLWVMNRSPLIFGGDPTKLDAPTIALLTNDEVLEIQKSSSSNSVIAGTGPNYFAQKAIGTDGTVYAAIFNMNIAEVSGAFSYSLVNLSGSCLVRDVWALTDLGTFANSFNFSVATHGARLFAISGCT
eukprot:Phypoly_transcript_07886.p1 GENE.Phypoly_transcript_07886~~Phypoly_transcript_07886.p1  ORF type:complete len:447 (+),score=53.57 Phypoly_transcript_07886:189-1529(+)